MMNTADLVVGLVASNGGELVGKTRLQKLIFLLDACGLNSGVDFDYHHYGPFSAEVALAADNVQRIGRLTAHERLGFHSVPYTVYETNEPAPQRLGGLKGKDLARILEVLNAYSALELELAATILYLRENGFKGNAAEETRRRKPAKATPDRLARAVALLEQLDLT